ncbi:hypothetical protein GQ42DRAFT_21396 [Ramicandelaber brevisporus]|nr:hypothetical protein GQ42DRAFT_48030 [Ramicandelaber brevisporus]KAI8870017.1 hypothetical protein GQ42DRAFT_21396 [Ramicandelaber brevisporus]
MNAQTGDQFQCERVSERVCVRGARRRSKQQVSEITRLGGLAAGGLKNKVWFADVMRSIQARISSGKKIIVVVVVVVSKCKRKSKQNERWNEANGARWRMEGMSVMAGSRLCIWWPPLRYVDNLILIAVAVE